VSTEVEAPSRGIRGAASGKSISTISDLKKYFGSTENIYLWATNNVSVILKSIFQVPMYQPQTLSLPI